jgi:hypothetical protein
MADNRGRFLNAYNRLDNYLRDISGAPTNKTMISYLQRILPEDRSSTLNTIREFKNKMYSHSVTPSGDLPQAPDSWIRWLEDMLTYCKQNRSSIARQLSDLLKKSDRNGHGQRRNNDNSGGARGGSGVTKCSFCQFYNGSKCTNYYYYYNGTKMSMVSEYAKQYAEYRKDPCPAEAIRKYEEYLARQNGGRQQGGGANPYPSQGRPVQNNPPRNTPPRSNNPRPAHRSQPAESATTADGNLRLRAVLERGDGRYTKGIFNKKQMVNFRLNVSIENQDGLKISSIIAIVEGRGARHKEILSTRLDNTVEFDLPTDVYGGHIEASVVVVYKIGVFKSKEIKVRVSKNF